MVFHLQNCGRFFDGSGDTMSAPPSSAGIIDNYFSSDHHSQSAMSVDLPITKALAETRFFAAQNVHDIPGEKMNEMSAQERTAGFYDLHGVSECLVEETPELIAEKLAELDLAMLSLLVEERAAYDLARETNDEYVQSLRLAFLRAENFDVPNAALRMARHYDFRLTMFGKEVMGRDIGLSDLPDLDRSLFEKGFMQICKGRDRAGRAIEIQMMRQLGKEPPPTSAARLFFFCMCIIGAQEMSQMKGVVLMEYMVGIKVDQLLSTDRRARNPLFLKVMASMPVRLSALHVCFDDPRIRTLFRLLTSVIEGKLLCRLQSHFGTDLECLYSLMAFGISPSCLPVRSDGSIDTTDHMRMLARLSQNDASIAGSTTSSLVVGKDEDDEASPPTAEDVLMGRGKHGKKWPGNLRLRRLVDTYKDSYKATDRDGKIAISKAIYDEMIISGSRFLVPTKNSSKLDGGWVEMPRSEVCIRISHLFRNLRASERSGVS